MAMDSDSFKRLFKSQGKKPQDTTDEIKTPEPVKNPEGPQVRTIRVQEPHPDLAPREQAPDKTNLADTSAEDPANQDIKSEYAFAKNRQRDMENQLNDHKNFLQRIMEEQTIITNRIQSKTQEKESLKTLINNILENIIPGIESQIKNTETEILQIQNEMQTKQELLANLLKDTSKQKENLTAIQSKETEIRQKYFETKSNWEKLNEELRQLERDISRKNRDNQRANDLVSQTENKMAQYSQLVERTNKSIQLTELDINQRQQELTSLGGALSADLPKTEISDTQTKKMEKYFWAFLSIFLASLVIFTIWQAVIRLL
jgi:chromosome segregation ATPase